MAIEPDLKQHYQNLEAKPEEMDKYRHNLAAQLAISQPHTKSASNGFKALAFNPSYLAIAASIAIVVFFSSSMILQPSFPQQELEELQALIDSSDREVLRQRAQKLINNNDHDALNSTMIITQLSGSEEKVESALQGLEIEPRPEFRRYYLEMLLDMSEVVYVNPSYLETTMENEFDSVCLELYQLLLKYS